MRLGDTAEFGLPMAVADHPIDVATSWIGLPGGPLGCGEVDMDGRTAGVVGIQNRLDRAVACCPRCDCSLDALARHVRVRQASAEDFDRRPVVRLSVRFGYLKKSSDFVQSESTEFTLTDRSRMTYPLLLGRDFLKDIAVVDVARKYIQPKPQITDIP